MGMEDFKLCVSPTTLHHVSQMYTCSYLFEISQIRHVLQEKEGSLQAPQMQDRLCGITAICKCADKFRRGREVSVPHEIPVHSTAAPLQLLDCKAQTQLNVSFQDRRETAALCSRLCAAASSLQCNTAGMAVSLLLIL